MRDLRPVAALTTIALLLVTICRNDLPGGYKVAAATTPQAAFDATQPSSAVAASSVPSTGRAFPTPGRIPGIANFAQVADGLYRGEQPTAEGFAQLQKMGVKTIVNLRAFHTDRDEIKGMDFRYVHLPGKAWYPEDQDIITFLKVVSDPANQPVFVHCQHGADRTVHRRLVARRAVRG